MNEKRFTYFKVPLGFGKQAIKDNANDEVFDFTLSNVLDKLNEQQSTITELKSIINFVSDEGDLIVLLMKEIIKLRQEVQECRAYETIEKGVSHYD